jgi:hypothetical protein
MASDGFRWFQQFHLHHSRPGGLNACCPLFAILFGILRMTLTETASIELRTFSNSQFCFCEHFRTIHVCKLFTWWYAKHAKPWGGTALNRCSFGQQRSSSNEAASTLPQDSRDTISKEGERDQKSWLSKTLWVLEFSKFPNEFCRIPIEWIPGKSYHSEPFIEIHGHSELENVRTSSRLPSFLLSFSRLWSLWSRSLRCRQCARIGKCTGLKQWKNTCQNIKKHIEISRNMVKSYKF